MFVPLIPCKGAGQGDAWGVSSSNVWLLSRGIERHTASCQALTHVSGLHFPVLLPSSLVAMCCHQLLNQPQHGLCSSRSCRSHEATGKVSLHVHLAPTLPRSPRQAKVLFLGKPARCGSCHIHFSAVSSWRSQMFWAPARWVDHGTDCPVKEEHDGHWRVHREQQRGQILRIFKPVNTLTRDYFPAHSSFILTREFLIRFHTPEEMHFYFTKGRWGIGSPVASILDTC